MALRKVGKAIRCVCDRIYRPALINHLVAAAIEHENALRPLTCKTVIDIGANRGQFALVARRCFPLARIISFEPLATPAKEFGAIFRNDPEVVLHQAAVGPVRERRTMHIAGRDDSSSLLPLTPTQNRLFPGTAEVGTVSTDVAPLQDFLQSREIPAPAMLKIDVQGFELQVLRGCESLLERFAYVYAECSFIELYKGQALADEVIAWLRERRFRLTGIYNMVNDVSGKAIQADFFFVSN